MTKDDAWAESLGFKNRGGLIRLRTEGATLAAPEWLEAKKDLDLETIRGFVNVYLRPGFDNPKAIAPLHNLLWSVVISNARYAAIAAPRGTSKTTSISLVSNLVLMLFRVRSFMLVTSSVESIVVKFVEAVKLAIQDNKKLQNDFGVVDFKKDNETELVIEFSDGHQACIRGLGFNQRFRGQTWKTMRPDFILMDDVEDDEAVENPARRRKSLNTLVSALLPCGSDDCVYRICGTVLHMDSLLNKLLHNSKWASLFAQAQHDQDLDVLLWEDKLSKERLAELKSLYEEEGLTEKYYMEYFNRPVTEGTTFFRRADFLPMTDDDYASLKVYFAAQDFAISETQEADYTAILVGGMDSKGILCIVDCIRERCGSLSIIEDMIGIQRRYKPEMYTVEAGVIEKAIGPFLRIAMMQSNEEINLNPITPTKSKLARAKSIQLMMRAGKVRFDTKADWFPAFLDELMSVTPGGIKGGHDDMFDAFAYLGLAIHQYHGGPSHGDVYNRALYSDSVVREESGGYDMFNTSDACSVTGY